MSVLRYLQCPQESKRKRLEPLPSCHFLLTTVDKYWFLVLFSKCIEEEESIKVTHNAISNDKSYKPTELGNH